MDTTQDPHLKFSGDAQEAGQYFRYMAEFVGFTQNDAEAIHESGLIIEKVRSLAMKYFRHICGLRYRSTSN